MNFTVRRSTGLTVGLLFAVGILLGLGLAPTLSILRRHGPAGAVAGRRGHRAVHRRVRRGRLRDPAGPVGGRPGRASALIALIVFGIVLIFVHIPAAT